MRARADIVFIRPESYRFLGRMISGLRWATIAVVFLMSLLGQPGTAASLPRWAPILGFAAYSLLSDVVRFRMPTLRSFTVMALLDLPVAGAVYVLGMESSGIYFVLFFMTVVSAAATLQFVGGLLYACAVAVLVVVIHFSLTLSGAAMADTPELVARLLMLALAAIAMGLLTRRLALEEAAHERVQRDAEMLVVRNQLRDEFVAAISHNLRTPLTAIQAGVGLIEASSADRLRPDERDLVRNVRRNVVSLGRLIDDLVAYNQLEAGALRVESIDIDAAPLVAEVVASVQPLLQKKDQHLETDIPPTVPVRADPRALEQILANLLANAHLHTPSGTHIHMEAVVTEQVVRFVVRDDGPGIPSDEHEAIFERFYRGTAHGVGTGLGLTIAKAFVELQAGQIRVENVSPIGTAFVVTLPRQPGASRS